MKEHIRNTPERKKLLVKSLRKNLEFQKTDLNFNTYFSDPSHVTAVILFRDGEILALFNSHFQLP